MKRHFSIIQYLLFSLFFISAFYSCNERKKVKEIPQSTPIVTSAPKSKSKEDKYLNIVPYINLSDKEDRKLFKNFYTGFNEKYTNKLINNINDNTINTDNGKYSYSLSPIFYNYALYGVELKFKGLTPIDIESILKLFEIKYGNFKTNKDVFNKVLKADKKFFETNAVKYKDCEQSQSLFNKKGNIHDCVNKRIDICNIEIMNDPPADENWHYRKLKTDLYSEIQGTTKGEYEYVKCKYFYSLSVIIKDLDVLNFINNEKEYLESKMRMHDSIIKEENIRKSLSDI